MSCVILFSWKEFKHDINYLDSVAHDATRISMNHDGGWFMQRQWYVIGTKHSILLFNLTSDTNYCGNVTIT